MQDKEERVLAAAREVFMRYGFKRTTMSDLAEAAHMSRPALYLIYPSKEDVFRLLMAQVFNEFLCEIRDGLKNYESVADKLTFAFEVWCVRSFEIMQALPDAKDMLENGYEFASDTMQSAYAEFEQVLSDVFQPLVRTWTEEMLSAEQLAHILTTASLGLKESASSVVQLRQMIKGLIMVVVAGLQHMSE